MDENLKVKLTKKACLPIKVATIVLIIEFLIFLLEITEMIPVTVEMYNSYNLETPGLVKSLSNIIDAFQNNTLTGILICIGILGVVVILNILWKYIAKKIINNSKLEIEVLEKKVDKFKNIATISISIVLIMCFGLICISVCKAMIDIYMNSFLFEINPL